MAVLYKLTDEKHQSYGGCQWGENVTHETGGKGELCGPGWLHAYTHSLLAVLLNPMHADFVSPVLWEAEGEIGKTDNGLKVGTTRLTTLRILPLPAVTTEQRVRFGILCALEVCQDVKWRVWAQAWLDNSDRSAKAAWAAAAAAEAWAAAWAAAAAADAARAAAWAAAAADAARAAAWAADAAAAEAEAADAAEAAAEAADAAAWAAAAELNLIALAEKAMQ